MADEVSFLAEIQTAPDHLPDNAPRLTPLLFDPEHRPITTLEAWQAERKRLRRLWLALLGKLEVQRPEIRLKVLKEDRLAGVVRRLVRYENEPGLACEAYWIFPEALRDPAPGVVVLHSTTNITILQPAGLAGDPEDHHGLHLARDHGMVTFSPRNYLWQEDEGKGYLHAVERLHQRRPGVTGMAKMLYDATRAVDALAGMDMVDPKRIGSIGHSLGGKEVLYLCAFDDRVGATVSSEGGIGLAFSNWHDPWYLGARIREPGFELENHQVLGLAAPKPFLLLGGDSADGDRSWPFIDAVLPVYRLYREPARVGLYNHRKGHSIPPPAEQRAYAWLTTYL